MHKSKQCGASEVIIHGQHNVPTLLRAEGERVVMRRWDAFTEDWGSYTIWEPLDIRRFLKLIGKSNEDNAKRRRTSAESKLFEAQREVRALKKKLERLEREYLRELGHRQELQREIKELRLNWFNKNYKGVENIKGTG